VGGHAVFLGMEFATAWRIGARDAVPRAGARQFLRAWMGESWAAACVFCWRQPWRWHAVADHLPAGRRRGAVLIHGFVCNRAFWNPWLRELRAADRAFVAVDLEPVFGSIDGYVAIIEEAIVRVTAATGQPPLLICHSMGGLAARAWLRASQGSRVHRIVTIGTPHAGTWLARFGRTANGREMRMGGAWMRKIESPRADARAAAFTCWHSNCDNIVFPPSTTRLKGADNRLVEGQGHVELAFHRPLRRATLALLDS
jgi:Alpha/beta hydrolase family